MKTGWWANNIVGLVVAALLCVVIAKQNEEIGAIKTVEVDPASLGTLDFQIVNTDPINVAVVHDPQ